MKSKFFVFACSLLLVVAVAAQAEQYQLLTGVDAGLTPGALRMVSSTSGGSLPFFDGDRLAGTTGTSSAAWQGNNPGNLFYQPNQFGALSFLYRRGSLNFGGPATPIMSIEYLGGPLLDLDGDLGNGSRSLTPSVGVTPVEIPGSRSQIGLSFDKVGGQVSLNAFDVTGTNSGSPGLAAEFGTTVNTLAGTQPNGSAGAAINPGVDTRQGSLAFVASGVTRIDDLGYEFWQDAIGSNSSTASTLGTTQSLGRLEGWLIERDINGDFPTLAGLGLVSIWPATDMSEIGNSFNFSSGGTGAIANGNANDLFNAPNNGGLALADFGGDLGAYIDAVVIPQVDPNSQSFVFLHAAGFGMNNSIDPVFGETNGYDLVLVAQSTPIPEPTTALMLMLGAAFIAVRSKW